MAGRAVWEDPRVIRGMDVHLGRQRDAGARRIGWKVGLGAPAALERLGTTGALVAGLSEATLVSPGGSVSVAGWAKPTFEPEIAALIGSDVEPGGSLEDAAAAITALAPAIEMVDLAAPPSDPEQVLAAGFAHRAVVVGAPDEARAGGDVSGLATRVVAVGDEGSEEELGASEDPVGAIGGNLVAIVRHVADYVGAFGERLRAGELVITGSTIAPPPVVRAGQHVRFELRGVGDVDVRLTE